MLGFSYLAVDARIGADLGRYVIDSQALAQSP
jgi:hypothetical protein